MGVSHPRVSMLISLTFLAPALQEILLAGRPEACQVNFHQLLRISRMLSWDEQRTAWRALSQELAYGNETGVGSRAGGGMSASQVTSQSNPGETFGRTLPCGNLAPQMAAPKSDFSRQNPDPGPDSPTRRPAPESPALPPNPAPSADPRGNKKARPEVGLFDW